MKLRIPTVIVLLYLSIISLSSLTLLEGTDQTERKSTDPHSNGYIVLENTDVEVVYIDANGQGVNIQAPTLLGTVQPWPNFQAVLNNVYTTTGFFLQNGIGIDTPWNGGGIEWTTSNQSLIAQSYAIPYYAGHTYQFAISPSNNNPNAWQLCAGDTQIPANYQCRQENGTGRIDNVINTSVFAETNVPARGWETRIKGNFKVTNLVTFRQGYAYPWTTVHRHTYDKCVDSWQVMWDSVTKKGAVQGNPINGGSVELKKKGLPSKAIPPGSNC